MSSFLTEHIIKKIHEQISQKQSILNHEHFFYFDSPVEIGQSVDSPKIDRVNRWNPFVKNEILPTSFYHLRGQVLIEIFNKLKYNEFFIYKNYLGKDHKIRIKKDDTRNKL